MKIINDNKEFEEFYPYDKKYIKEYPKKYPCIVKWEFEEIGIMGDEKVVYVAYYPNKNSLNDLFFDGLNYKWCILK